MDTTSGLNIAQKEAVLHTDGPLLIVAGAGAGKTKTIVHRICNLIQNGNSASSVLAVTFTNKAAKEMRERVEIMIKNIPGIRGELEKPFVSTFHSLGVFLLRKFGAHGGVTKRFSILDDGDTNTLIKDSILSLGLDPKINDPRGIKSIISKASNALQSPEDLESEANPHYRLAGRVWNIYISKKKEQKALDFDDLLLETVNLLEKNSEAISWCQNTWKYIHIDEYQDTNEVQYRIATALAGSTKNICVVGDSDQSIYSWRGANIKNILEFERDYPNCKIVVLEENYRSTKNVLSAANKIINKNNFRTPKELFTNNSHGEKISQYTAYDENDEASFIVERVIEHIDSGTKIDEIAVLFRTNFQSRALEEAFLSFGIPYQVLGVKFFERKEIKDIMSYIRLALNPDNLVDIKRVINFPTRGIGKVSLLKLFSEGKSSLSGKALIAVNSFYDILEKINNYTKDHCVSEILKFTIEESGIKNYYKKEYDGDEHLENLEELVTIGTKYDHFESIEGLEKMIEEATLMSDQDNLDNEKLKTKNGVKLMTIHAAKGLEFSIVFLCGLEQGLFPHDRDKNLTGADAEEERRLMYVAITRARRKLYLSYASMRTIYGMRDVRMPSEFLIDIPEELIVRESRTGESSFGTVFL